MKNLNNLTACSLFLSGLLLTGLASCNNNDDSVDTPPGTHEDLDIEEARNDEAVYQYLMSQFAILDSNGNLKRRTRFSTCIDELDSTAFVAITPNRQKARQTFLSLLPPENRKLVSVSKDSAEMEYPLGDKLKALTYRESGAGGNELAYVSIPSQGEYTKIVNSLTMIHDLGANSAADDDIKLVIGTTKEFTFDAYCECMEWNDLTITKSHKITEKFVCYKYDRVSNTAYYFWIPPLRHLAQLQVDDESTVTSDLQAYAFLDDEDDVKISVEPLSAESEVEDFCHILWGDMPYLLTRLVENNRTILADNDRNNQLFELTTNFVEKSRHLGLYEYDYAISFSYQLLSCLFPYFKQYHTDNSNAPYADQDAEAFLCFNDSILLGSELMKPASNAEIFDPRTPFAQYYLAEPARGSLDFLTRCVYGRQRGDRSLVYLEESFILHTEVGDFVVLDRSDLENGNVFIMYMKPKSTSPMGLYCKRGRDMANHASNPMRPIYIRSAKVSDVRP